MLLQNIRKIILSFSALLASGIYIYVLIALNSERLQTIRLIQLYAFISTIYLYFSLLASPLYAVFPNLPFRVIYIKARRALGVSAFFFAILHGAIAFFGSLGGFAGLGFLSNNYLVAISLGFTTLIILGLLTLTSTNAMVRKLGGRWKPLHRLVYVAGIFIVIHALMLGTHFNDLSKFIPQLFMAALGFLLLLELLRIDKYIAQRFRLLPRFGVPALMGVAALAISGFMIFIPPEVSSNLSLGIHAAHIQLAQQAQQGQTQPALGGRKIPGLDGDPTKRYSVSFNNPQNLTAGSNVELRFKVSEATNGIPVSFYRPIQEKLAHLIIVDSELNYFEHIHPEQRGSEFFITTKFPKDGRYHLYLDFQPWGGIEQQIAQTLSVGTVQQPAALANQSVDMNTTKQFGDYEVTLKTNGPLKAQQMSVGRQAITFTIADAKTKQPITNLEPYLAAFGHLVMLNQKTYDYIHVHPSRLTPLAPNEKGGPSVEFLPLGIYGPIKPGNYRAFGQFNHNGKIFTADFTVKVE